MPKSLGAIYGADDNDFALGIASDALTSGVGSEDIWGPVEDMRAQSQANVGKESLGPSDPKAPMLAKNLRGFGKVDYPNDTPKHEKGPSSATATGGKASLVPANQKDPSTGKQKGPAYTNETA
jgi:hypothetical protein